jgi:hypothetical protein
MQLAVYILYIALDATIGTGQFATFYEAVYTWFSRGLLTRLGQHLFGDPWATASFVMIIGPLVGIFIYSLVFAAIIAVVRRVTSRKEQTRP